MKKASIEKRKKKGGSGEESQHYDKDEVRNCGNNAEEPKLKKKRRIVNKEGETNDSVWNTPSKYTPNNQCQNQNASNTPLLNNWKEITNNNSV